MVDFCKLNECEINFAIAALANSLAEGLDEMRFCCCLGFLASCQACCFTISTFRAVCEHDKDQDKNQTIKAKNNRFFNAELSNKKLKIYQVLKI